VLPGRIVQLKILYSIISFYAVYVVYHLAFFQESIYVRLHNYAVLGYIALLATVRMVTPKNVPVPTSFYAPTFPIAHSLILTQALRQRNTF
jgi:multisubunit Na+/H+ antiporter MnhC subunit